MESTYWHERWQQDRIGFHQPEPNRHLLAFFAHLNLAPTQRIFVPLCGKSHDLGWLIAQGHPVVGVELSEVAVTAIYRDLGLTPNIEVRGEFKHYQHEGLEVFQGDVFALTTALLGSVAAIYDRAALVALPAPMRRRYAEHLWSLAPTAPQFLVSLELDQPPNQGPPFTVDAEQIETLYGRHYNCLCTARIELGATEKRRGFETAWLLRAKVLP